MEPAKATLRSRRLSIVQAIELLTVAALVVLAVTIAITYAVGRLSDRPATVEAPADYAYASWIDYRLPLKAAASPAETYAYGSWIDYRLPTSPRESAPAYEYGSWIEYRLNPLEADDSP